ncbi:MAG: 1-acyl-sn-glycerol-3-phosphate acyltransferase [Candidatus Omnitrophica bacterium]|nr:1-acyl-sn-glycerol-3-phosphate acyltransferase [Candidatus Omnitrophota bacterium]
MEWRGAENVPQDRRGVILAPNHASYLDPPIVGVALKRPVTYLAKEYLFKPFPLGHILTWIGVLPIKGRADDFRSVRQLLRVLEDGQCVVIFPEGTRTSDGRFQDPEGGVGFLAAKSRSWVVPVYIQGTFEAFPRSAKFFKCCAVKVFFGKPFIPAEDSGLLKKEAHYLAVSQKIMSEIEKIKQGL